MAILNQFQHYTQKENTITNNVMLMFSNLFEINPRYYEDLINNLLDSSNQYEAVPEFLQQKNNRGNGIIDGYIEIKPSKIIIETKVHGTEGIDKLVKYTDSFDKKENSILLHLSTEKYSGQDISKIKAQIKEKENEVGPVFFQSISFRDISESLEELAKEYSYEESLNRLSSHFTDYCSNSDLMPSKHILRAMACGGSFELNKKHAFYFDLAHRGSRPFNYLGIYKEKEVHYIGSVEKMIVADWGPNTGLNIDEEKSDKGISPEQKERLTKAIKDSHEAGWGVAEGHKFFLLKDFTKTAFKKQSSGGIFRVKYFDLEDLLIEKELQSVPTIAKALDGKNWPEK